MPRWTDEQLDAIHSGGENIIVSAGAGSGKTAVLTNRVITKLKHGTNINELLVLTFTNAAAKEMKERIRKEITKDESLKEMLDYIDSSYITTFDSFSLSVVKKYHYLLGIGKDVSIIEPSIINLEMETILEMIMDEEYKLENPDFSKLITDFCLKDDNNITSSIIKMYRKVSLIYNFQEYLNNYISLYFNDEKINSDINRYIVLIKLKINKIIDLLNELKLIIDGDYYFKIEDALRPLLDATDYEMVKNSVSEIIYPRLKPGSADDVKALNQSIKDTLKEISGLVRYESVEEIKASIYITKPYISTFIRLILKLDEEITKYKRRHNLYEFNDIAVMAIKLVKDYELVRNELKNQFHEILVDEYQDTSDLQELFITTISNNNVYMVGDIKQSIYMFRNANPNIFRNKYNLYREHNGGKKIDLNKNFRSRNVVLDNINKIFNVIMDDEIGGADYEIEHQLSFGNTSYVESGTTSQDMNMEIYNYSLDKTSPYTAAEVEAFFIARDIKEKIDNHYQVFDKELGVLRDIKYSDIAILINKTKNFELYKKIFTYLEIPMDVNKDQLLTDAKIISVIKNIFKLLISDTKDSDFMHAYTSVARSFLFELSDEYIFDRVVYKKFSDDIIISKINNLKDKINTLSNKQILEIVINEFDIYEKLILIGDIDENMIRIDYLYDLASNMSKIGYDIYKFTNYISEIFNHELDIKYESNKSDSDAVKIMTIHKSKGLEFYICYYPELNNNFNLRDLNDRFNFYNKEGIITPYYDNGIKRTIYIDLLKEAYYNDTISEEIRLFYVALTRAKEKMIMVCDLNKDIIKKDTKVVESSIRKNYRSFADILISIKDNLDVFIKNIEPDKLDITSNYQINIKNLDLKFDPDVKKEVLDFEFKTDEIDEKVFSHSIDNLKSYEEVMLLLKGVYFHEVLEMIDLKNPNLNQLDLSSDCKDKVEMFLNQKILDNIMDAKIYQEYEFIDNKNHRHGVVDLMLVYSDSVDIIDYKLENIDNPNYVEQLNGYKDYINKKTGKSVNIYLYSIMKGEVKKLD